MQLTLFVGVLALLLIWFFLRQRNQAKDEPSTAGAKRADHAAYHAVSIQFDANACDAAKAMAGRRFLSSAAPRLPLAECKALECRCRFAHHKDRRSGQDRRSPFSAAKYSDGTGSFKKERRERLDRRKDADRDEF
jgi:hypothetical protein